MAATNRWDRKGCTIAAVVAVLAIVAAVVAGFTWRQRAEQEALQAQEQRAQAEFEPVLEKLEAASSEPSYDIDKTVRVIHGVDMALEQSESLKDYLQVLAREDYRGVAPDVLEARGELLDILLRLYGKQTEAEEQQALWELSSELLLQTLSVVQVQGDLDPLTPSGGFSVDRDQAKRLLDDMKQRQAEHDQLLADVDSLENELIDALFRYSETWYRYLEEWDRLCVLRDRAWLAASNGDWQTVITASEAAIAMAPDEREAHLLLAWAIIESGDVERGDPGQILEQYIGAHPDSTAPAFLLLGAWKARNGDDAGARLDFQQSATYFPRQADQLTSMLDPYEMRTYLRKSREGTWIVELYKDTMLGAGYFSPDLQMARQHFAAGEADKGRAKVLDHFARRRSQQQWDFLISDIEFCADLLGADYRLIFPEDAYLDLEVAPTLMGGGLKLAVRNRSDRTLHNATLVLALHLTDMHPADYETLTAQATMPAVVAHQTTDFGTVAVAIPMFGTVKGVSDIVRTRAILVSNEAVVWVDTDEYKVAEAAEFRAGRTEAAPPSGDDVRRRLHDRAREALARGTTFEVVPRALLGDDVTIELPKEISALRPVFRLRYRGVEFTAEENVIDNDKIKLRFAGVGEFGPGSGAGPMVLEVGSVFGGLALDFAPNGDVTWRLTDVRPED